MNSEIVHSQVNHFRGRSEHTLDGKGRLSIPARFRDVLRKQSDERLVITPSQKYLKVYPLPQWIDIEIQLMEQLKVQPELKKMVEWTIESAVECSLDKQGRILLPPLLREECNIGKDVVVSGAIKFFKVLGKETWEADSKPTQEDFDKFESSLLSSGLL